jgi:Mrp family chromosome partitioning ATPase
MRNVIKELWEFSITIWKQRNAELHGTDGAISMEQLRKDTANEAASVYQATLGNVSPTDSVVLHHARIDDILKWTKEHLDAYLATAEVIIDQRDEPG